MSPAGRAILVDDSAELRLLLKILLADAGWEVVAEAADGLEAIEAADNVPTDLVVMDLNMPRMDGLEATREIRRRHPGLLIVAFTCTVEPATIQALLDAGAACQFDKTEINSLVEHLAAMRRTGALDLAA